MVDTHCHLSDGQFENELDDVLERAGESEVVATLSVATDLDDARRTLSLVSERAHLRSTVGIHPNYASNFDLTLIEPLREMAANRLVVAIGEIGLDFYRDFTPVDRQFEAFEAQLALASELSLPIVVHNRLADDGIIERLEAHSQVIAGKTGGRPLGVLHCFSGDRALAARALDAGYLVSLAGNLTYRSAANLREVAEWLPADAILIETDAPYLAPVPFRGKRNEPRHLIETFGVLAELRKTPSASLAEQLRANCQRVFDWPAPRDGAS